MGEGMHITEIVLIFICLLLLITLCIREKNEKQTIKRIEKMIDAAITGRFVDEKYDENVVSKLEEKLNRFLSSTEISENRIRDEKDRIKTLISDISHQTKTPIANLKLYTELLKEENLSPSVKENVDTLYLQVEKLSFLIDNLVKLSRLENGIIQLNLEPNTIDSLLDEIRLNYKSQAEIKGLKFTIDKSNSMAIFDFKWTLEAIGNIIENAIKYTDSGEIKIKVIQYELFVRIDIIDSGKGVDYAEREKIFSRFYRSPNVNNKNGLGIGLYLTREILSAEGGYVKVGKNDDKGAIFSVYIPKS